MTNDLVANHGGDFGRAKGSWLTVIGLNPSTADETQNDPTITRCIDYAMRWGFDSLCMMNIFGFRSTDPKGLRKYLNPIGDSNDLNLMEVLKKCDVGGGLVLAAWGNHGALKERGYQVARLAVFLDVPLHCLGVTKLGHPKHPLYLSKELLPVTFIMKEKL